MPLTERDAGARVGLSTHEALELSERTLLSKVALVNVKYNDGVRLIFFKKRKGE